MGMAEEIFVRASLTKVYFANLPGLVALAWKIIFLRFSTLLVTLRHLIRVMRRQALSNKKRKTKSMTKTKTMNVLRDLRPLTLENNNIKIHCHSSKSKRRTAHSGSVVATMSAVSESCQSGFPTNHPALLKRHS